MGTGTSSRAAVVAASFVLTTALIVGGAILIARQTGDFDGWVAVASGSFTCGAIGPILLGAWLAYWDPRRSEEARRVLGRVRVTVIAVEVVASVVLIWSLTAAGAPPWVGAVLVVGLIAATLAAPRVGGFIRRTAVPVPTSTEYPRETASRDVRRIGLAAGITFIVAAASLLLLTTVTDLQTWEAVGFSFVAAAFAISVTGNLVTLRLGRTQRAMFDGDVGRLRKIGKIVLGRRRAGVPASDEDLADAARYASTVWVTLSYQAVALLSLFVALALGQVISFVTSDSAFSLAMAVACAVFALVFTWLALVQIQRARRYAREHPVGE